MHPDIKAKNPHTASYPRVKKGTQIPFSETFLKKKLGITFIEKLMFLKVKHSLFWLGMWGGTFGSIFLAISKGQKMNSDAKAKNPHTARNLGAKKYSQVPRQKIRILLEI